MEITALKAEKYAVKYTSPLDDLLSENEALTLLGHPHAQMHSGHVQGKVLEMLSMMIKPVKILEIGTFTGFSALCLARGLQAEGTLHTIELREEDARTATAYFNRSPYRDKIKLHPGDARKVLTDLIEPWDLIFIDADKTSYIEYYELTLPYLKQGGWLIADNVLFHGQVLQDEVTGKNAKAIQAFNEHIASDERVEQVMLTVRDGLLVIRKL